jgi:hypothetical protein
LKIQKDDSFSKYDRKLFLVFFCQRAFALPRNYGKTNPNLSTFAKLRSAKELKSLTHNRYFFSKNRKFIF